MTSIRPVTVRGYRPSDRGAMADICIRTGHAGGDATGLMREPEVLPAVFAAPYAAFDPGLVFVADDGERVIGYIVGAADSAAYYADFRARWLPAFADRYPDLPEGAEPRGFEEVIRFLLHHPEAMLPADIAAEYPAHLHIDLLPRGQRRGLGRRLMTAFLDALRERGMPGVHLGMNPANTGARAFYDRLGFTELRGPAPGADVVYLGRKLP